MKSLLILLITVYFSGVQASSFKRYMKFNKDNVVDVQLRDGSFKDAHELTRFTGTISSNKDFLIDITKTDIENVQLENGQIIDIPQPSKKSKLFIGNQIFERTSGSGGGGPG